MNLISLIFRAPWYVFVLLGAGVAYFGYTQTDTVNQRIAEIEAAIASPPPAVVPLGRYTRPDVKFAEGGFVAQIALDAVVRLVDKKNGVTTDTDYMIPLADPDAPDGTREFPALMILSKAEFELYEDWVYDNMVGFGALGRSWNSMASRRPMMVRQTTQRMRCAIAATA